MNTSLAHGREAGPWHGYATAAPQHVVGAFHRRGALRLHDVKFPACVCVWLHAAKVAPARVLSTLAKQVRFEASQQHPLLLLAVYCCCRPAGHAQPWRKMNCGTIPLNDHKLTLHSGSPCHRSAVLIADGVCKTFVRPRNGMPSGDILSARLWFRRWHAVGLKPHTLPPRRARLPPSHVCVGRPG